MAIQVNDKKSKYRRKNFADKNVLLQQENK